MRIVLVLLIVLSHSGLAQKSQWGLRMGVNVSRFRWDKMKNFDNPYIKYGLSPELAVNYQYKTVPRLYIQADLTTGQRLNKSQGEGVIRGGSYIRWRHLSNWWVSSLGAGAKYLLLVKPAGAYGLAGVQLECWHRASMVDVWTDSVKTQVFRSSSFDRNQFYWGYFLGAGYQYRIGRHDFYLEGRYQVGGREFKPLWFLHSYSYIFSVGLWLGKNKVIASNRSLSLL